jgi:lipopolysaccharide export system permease protein
MKARGTEAPRAPWRVWAYFCKDFLVYFGVCFLFFFIMFFINQILYMAEQILSKHAPILEVAKLLLFAMPSFVSLSFPFATLLATLMSLGQFTSQNEILILQASGVSTKRLFAPFLAIGLALTGFSFFVNDFLLPIGSINFAKVYRRLIYSTPTLELASDTVKKYQDVTLVTGKVSKDWIQDITIMDSTTDRQDRVIHAKTARLVSDEGKKELITLDLREVFILQTRADRPQKYDYSTSDQMLYNILIQNFTESISGLSPRDMSALDLAKSIEVKQRADDEKKGAFMASLAAEGMSFQDAYWRAASAPGGAGVNPKRAYEDLSERLDAYRRVKASDSIDRSLVNSKREFHKKFSLPLASLCFIIFAFPIALLTKRNGRISGFIIGILTSFLYWVLMYLADLYGYNIRGLPSAIVWIPNIVIFLAGVTFMLARKMR